MAIFVDIKITDELTTRILKSHFIKMSAKYFCNLLIEGNFNV
jgi:hypothetical protein